MAGACKSPVSTKLTAFTVFILLATTVLSTNILANGTWDVLPTPVMMMDEAGIPLDPKEIAQVLSDVTQPPKLRYWAAMALAQLEAREYLPTIIQSLDDSVLLVQQGAMVALQHLPTDDAVQPLCLKSSSHSNRDIRYFATSVLFSVKTDAATKCIVRSATSVNEDYQTRWQALYHLWQNRDPGSAYDELVPTLDDENPTLRALAAMSLSKRHESDELVMDSLGIREALGAALLDHEMDMFTFNEAVERFEQLTGTEIMLDASQDIEYYNFDEKGRAIVDERIQAWLDGAE